jgi:hypothetical protein
LVSLEGLPYVATVNWASFFQSWHTLIYLFVAALLKGIPRASGLFGHSLGILGFILMLMTETLYTLRKRSRSARWGRMSTWLSFHIFTGIVGPYMVLLHSSWKFNGLAGVVMLMTVVVVASGFAGRYIYTAVPRSADGVELESGLLEAEIASADAELVQRLQAQPESARRLALQRIERAPAVEMPGGVSQYSGSEFSLVFGRGLQGWGDRLRWRWKKSRLDPVARRQLDGLEDLLKRRQQLRRQIASLAAARRLLALWHTIHIPIGLALFTAAFIHIVAAIYYATILR